MKPVALFRRLRRGEKANVQFSDMDALVRAFGFHLERISGSHHIYRHDELPVRLNVQPLHGQVKPYQIQQLLRAVERYGLQLSGDEDD